MFTNFFETVNGRQFCPHLGRHEQVVVFMILFVFQLLWARFANFSSRRWFGTGPRLLFSLNKSSGNANILSFTKKLEEEQWGTLFWSWSMTNAIDGFSICCCNLFRYFPSSSGSTGSGFRAETEKFCALLLLDTFALDIRIKDKEELTVGNHCLSY